MSLAVATILALGSCSHEKVDYVDPNAIVKDNIGYLSLEGMQASVMEDTENIESSTRAEGVDISDFDVVITDNKVSKQAVKMLEQAGVKVIIAQD